MAAGAEQVGSSSLTTPPEQQLKGNLRDQGDQGSGVLGVQGTAGLSQGGRRSIWAGGGIGDVGVAAISGTIQGLTCNKTL